MNSICVRFHGDRRTFDGVLSRLADKIRSSNSDIVGRLVYNDRSGHESNFTFQSLQGKTDLNALANDITVVLQEDSTFKCCGINVHRDDEQPTPRNMSVIIVSVSK